MKTVDVYFQSVNESPGHVNNVMCRMSGYHCILVIWVDGEMWFIFNGTNANTRKRALKNLGLLK